ncbi:MAG: SIMPL domain-containing protein [Campylobacteraceae bacterium]|jgi:uncharacterized protein YggE|nr:SIMPL domain-containing protein [Campylobacteraceae bacterium]
MKKILLIASIIGILAAQEENGFQTINRLKYGQNHISVGTISVQYEENVNFTPDTAEFSITYLTEGTTPNNASNRNIKNMDELKKYLKTLGVKESEINTVGYSNYQQSIYEMLDEKLYATKLTVIIKVPQENIYNIIELLEKNGIDNLKKDGYTANEELYYFTITAKAASENTAKKNAQEIFEKISKTLKNSGVAHIDIKEYETAQNSKETKEVKKYFVSNTIKIKTSNFDNIGKIFTKAQELKMTINDNLHYGISDAQREKVAKEVEGRLFEKLQEKAKRVINKSGFSLGAASNVHVKDPYTGNDDYYYRNGRNSVYAQAFQVQNAQEVDINPPSEYSAKFVINGSFDIIQEIKK